MISLQKAIATECENSWYQKNKYDQAEKEFYEKKAKLAQQQTSKIETPQVSKPEPQQVDKKEPEKAQPKEAKKIQKVEKTESPKLPKKKKSKTLPIAPKDTIFPTPELIETKCPLKTDPDPITEPDSSSITDPPPKKDKKKKKKKKGAVDTNISVDAKPKAQNGNVNMPSEVSVQKSQSSLEKENEELKQKLNQLTQLLSKLDLRVTQLEKSLNAQDKKGPAPAKPAAKPAPAKKQADDDDGVDLFASESEEEDEEAAKIKEQRLAEYNARKSKKPVLIAKSNIILDVKPWDDETDMKVMETEVRKIKTDGLVWGASKLVPLAYGIHKLQISCVVEDDKVSVDWLQETIQEIEEYVQSVDIAAFNKV